MPVIDNPNLGASPTIPDNLSQPPRTGGLTELVKDSFVLEVRHFFNTASTSLRLSNLGVPELPRIDKYSVAVDVSVDPLETAVNLIRSYPDITEDMPIIAVLATTGNNAKLNISDGYVDVVVPPARVLGGSGPFNLTSGSNLTLTTFPNGDTTAPVISNFTFPASMFANATAISLDDMVNVINFQALYVYAEKVTQNGVSFLGLRAGGREGRTFPNKVTITGGSAMVALGFTTNQTSQNYGPGTQAYTRHMISADLTVAMEVVAESENVRTELSDLLFDFFSFVIADRQFQFFGRSIFDPTFPDENYQIIIKDSGISISGEQEMPRPGDPRDKIYVNRINVPVTAIQYSDRIITSLHGQTVTPVAKIPLTLNNDLPTPS
jgi:hypothetical protein